MIPKHISLDSEHICKKDIPKKKAWNISNHTDEIDEFQ